MSKETTTYLNLDETGAVRRFLSVRCKTSQIQLIDLQPSQLYDALIALPRRLCGPKQYGLWMSPVFYRGQWRNPAYVEHRIREHKQGVEQAERKLGHKAEDTWTDLTYELLRILASNLGFITYDKLNEVLVKKGYVWNKLITMKNKEREDLTNYPVYSEEQDRQITLAHAEEEEEKARTRAHEEAFKKRKFVKDLEEGIAFQESRLRDLQSFVEKDADELVQIQSLEDSIPMNKERLAKAKRELETGAGLI